MRKVTIGLIFNEKNLTREEKIFLELAEKKNIELIMINTAKDIEEEIEDKIKKCDIIFNNSAEEFSTEIAKTIEELGKKVIDSSKKLYYDEDKWMFFLKCKKHKIPTIRTILLSENIPIAKKELRDFNEWPVVLKRIEGTCGEYVDKADNLKEAEQIIKKFWKKGSQRLPIIAQEFIKSPSYRVTIIGDKIVQTALKENKGWEATGVYAHHIKRFKVDKELKKIIKKIIRVFEIKICGIDFLKKNDKWLVLEINSSPGLDFFIRDRKKLIGKILDFLKKEAINHRY
jgi:RimK family alpha-L-glutamate ligase